MEKQFIMTLSLNSLNKHFLPYTLSETCNIYSKHPNKISILKQYFSLFDVYWGFRGLMMATILDAETAGSSLSAGAATPSNFGGWTILHPEFALKASMRA